ncbi:MAG: hypothetical protein H7199_09800 [Burkholderiales bacterium]|nr:hypothetical protein [Flavobacterium sp.]
MIFSHRSIFLLLLLLCFQIGKAQEVPKKEDPALMYRNIEKYSKKRKFTSFIHKLIFEPIAKKKVRKKKSSSIVKKKNLAAFECKIIRKIHIKTLDPFGYSEVDTTQKPTSFGLRAANAIHYKTRQLAIKNLLLIRKHTYLDTLLIMESERLIRSQRYIRSVVIRPELVSANSDSVDVYIRVLDSWSLVPDFSTSSSLSTFKLTEKNFFGTGHEFSNTYRKSLKSKDDAFSSSYTIPNILHSYTKATLSYKTDLENNYSKFFDIERPFYSTYTRWAGGIYVDQQYRKEVVVDSNAVEQLQYYKYNSQDYWGGHSVQIFSGNTEAIRGANLVMSARYYHKNYIIQPDLQTDPYRVYSDEAFYLVGLGVAARKFTQDKNVLNFNVTEDIASGVIYGLTGGYQNKNGVGRYYAGARFAYGKYFDFGYLSTNAEYGTFFHNGNSEQSAIAFSAVYFTNLIGRGRWKLRQFIKPQLTIGNKRLATNRDELTLDGENGIRGFTATTLFGTKKLLVTFQTQGYSPWNVYGFRLNPFLSYTMGMLGNARDGFSRSKLYSQIGVGIIISNDYLVFSSFQFSFSFYPTIPGNGDGVFKTNSFKTYDFTLQNFEVAKPQIVPYQ